MRAHEFICERKYKERFASVLSTAYNFTSMPGDSAYQMYRLGLVMANPDIEFVNGPAAANAVALAYTDAEEDIINRATKRMGHKHKPLSDPGSTEPDSVSTLSPIKPFKGYKK